MIPKVVLVGRPNVGKSTLFNRLVGYRKAIVYDRPGVTRDRNESIVQIQNRDCMLIDTGGYTFEPKQVIDKETVLQINKALEEAVCLVWVVDAKRGLHPEDQRLSKVFRKLNKPVVLAYNKVDPQTKKVPTWEFEKLGFKHSAEVSAEHGLGIDSLRQTIAEFLPPPAEDQEAQTEKPSEENVIHVALVGRPNVGKSSIINALIDQERLAVSEVPGTTRDMIDIAFEHEGQKYIFLDTAGMRTKRKVQDDVEYFSIKRTFEAIDRADVVMLILSGPDQLTTQEEKIAAQVIKNHKALSIFVNKWDLCEKGDPARKHMREEIYYKAPFLQFADVFFVSALEKKGLKKIFTQAKHLHNKINQRFDEEELMGAYKIISQYHHETGQRGHFLELKRLTAHNRSKRSHVFQLKCNKPFLATSAYERYWRNALIDYFQMRGVPVDVRFRDK